MAEVIANHAGTNVSEKDKASVYMASVMYFLFVLIELLLIFRLILKLMGAHVDQIFVYIIYTESQIFIAPFKGIADEVRTTFFGNIGFFDPGIFIALAFYPLLCFGIVKFTQLLPRKFR